jgi:hypothetical protein
VHPQLLPCQNLSADQAVPVEVVVARVALAVDPQANPRLDLLEDYRLYLSILLGHGYLHRLQTYL